MALELNLSGEETRTPRKKPSRLTPLAIAAALLAVPIFAGTAQAFFAADSLTVNDADTYTVSCKSGATKCIEMRTCDELPGSDTFQQVLAITSPTTLSGKSQDEIAVNGSCTGFQNVCRAGTTIGTMKGLAFVTHPYGTNGHAYSVEIHCLDKNYNVLPDTQLKVIQTEFNE
jgi:hypothetical protein